MSPAPCGSGQKYKNCCALRGGYEVKSNQHPILWGFGILIAIGGLVYALKAGSPERTAISGAAAGALIPQPPGPPPPGKVWSPEHGHYHNAPGSLGAAASEPADSKGSAGK